jgi:hypothetical protein
MRDLIFTTSTYNIQSTGSVTFYPDNMSYGFRIQEIHFFESSSARTDNFSNVSHTLLKKSILPRHVRTNTPIHMNKHVNTHIKNLIEFLYADSLLIKEIYNFK